MAHHGSLTSFSRRSFLQVSTAASAALALRIVTEPMLAYAQELPYAPVGGVRINANENPLGPCAAARSAVAAIMPEAGRYRFRLTEELVEPLRAKRWRESGPGQDFCRIERAAALHRHGLHLAQGELRDRRPRLRSRDVRRREAPARAWSRCRSPRPTRTT